MVKLAYVQQQDGVHTGLISERPASYQRTIPFHDWMIGDDIRFGGIRPAIESANRRYELFHVHTHMRDLNILEAVMQHSTIPYVWDCHDEPAEPVIDGPKSSLGPVRRLTGENGVVYRTYCPSDWFVRSKVYRKNEVVIATGLSDVPTHFMYWLDIFRAIKSMDIPLTCYTASFVTPEYREAARMLPPIDVRELIKQMSSFAVGICGGIGNTEHSRSQHPNKLYEYMAAGIPVICLGKQHEMASDIETWGVGKAIDDIAELPETMLLLEKSFNLRVVAMVRNHFTMEREWPKVREFYHSVLK